MRHLFIPFILVMIFRLELLQAQTKETLDSLILQDHSILTGKIYKYNRRGNVMIANINGELNEVKARNIQRIVIHAIAKQKDAGKVIKIKNLEPCEKPYAFREKGIYNASYGGSLLGLGVNNETELGFGLHHVVGYQWNRLLGAGLGFGLENFSGINTNGSLVFPVFVEARGYLLQKRKTPYYSLSAGYAFATKDKVAGLTAAAGGFRLHPAFGVRLGANDHVNFLLDLGYVFQSVTLTWEFNNWLQETQKHYIDYKRLCLRIGMIF